MIAIVVVSAAMGTYFDHTIMQPTFSWEATMAKMLRFLDVSNSYDYDLDHAFMNANVTVKCSIPGEPVVTLAVHFGKLKRR